MLGNFGAWGVAGAAVSSSDTAGAAASGASAGAAAPMVIEAGAGAGVRRRSADCSSAAVCCAVA